MYVYILFVYFLCSMRWLYKFPSVSVSLSVTLTKHRTIFVVHKWKRRVDLCYHQQVSCQILTSGCLLMHLGDHSEPPYATPCFQIEKAKSIKYKLFNSLPLQIDNKNIQKIPLCSWFFFAVFTQDPSVSSHNTQTGILPCVSKDTNDNIHGRTKTTFYWRVALMQDTRHLQHINPY